MIFGLRLGDLVLDPSVVGALRRLHLAEAQRTPNYAHVSVRPPLTSRL